MHLCTHWSELRELSDLTLITLTFGGADVEAARRLDAANLMSAIQALRWCSAHSLPERNELGPSDFQVDALGFCGVKAKKKKRRRRRNAFDLGEVIYTFQASISLAQIYLIVYRIIFILNCSQKLSVDLIMLHSGGITFTKSLYNIPHHIVRWPDFFRVSLKKIIVSPPKCKTAFLFTLSLLKASLHLEANGGHSDLTKGPPLLSTQRSESSWTCLIWPWLSH